MTAESTPPEHKVDLRGLMENFCDEDLSEWDIVRTTYKTKETAKRAFDTNRLRESIRFLVGGGSSPQPLGYGYGSIYDVSGARYVLLDYLDREMRTAAYYGFDPDETNPLFKEVHELLAVQLADVEQERQSILDYLGPV